jgi:hypothetical protein
LRQRKNEPGGYLTVRLYPGGKTYLVSRLVCRAFHGTPPDENYHADHIDKDRANNCFTNLRWLSPSENRARRNCASGSRNGSAKLDEDSVFAIRELAKTTSLRPTEFDAKTAERFGVTRGCIRNIRRGTAWLAQNETVLRTQKGGET